MPCVEACSKKLSSKAEALFATFLLKESGCAFLERITSLHKDDCIVFLVV